MTQNDDKTDDNDVEKCLRVQPETNDVVGLRSITNRKRDTNGQYARLFGITAALLYGACSMSMAFINKALLSSYDFKFPSSILAVQMAFIIVVLSSLNGLGYLQLPPLSLQRCRGFLLPSLFYASNAVLGLTALSSMNIPMYGVIKRMAPLAILILGTILLDNGRPSKRVVAAVLLMTFGCILAGYGDLTFNITAYACGLASSITQAMYLTLVQKHSDKLSVSETLQLISVNTLPILMLCSILKGEFTGVKNFFNEASSVPVAVFVLLALMITLGALLNFSMFLCTTYNSALTTSVVGIVKSVLSTIIGMFSFGGVAVNLSTVIGIATNVGGGILYSLTKYQEQKQTTKK